MVDGSFDPLHPGHLAYFRAARSLGYPLLCNICPDSETAKKHPVLLPARDRAEILAALDMLTYVHVGPTVEALRQLRPAFYVKGQDWLNALPVEVGQVCDELGIRIRYTESTPHRSSAYLEGLRPDVARFEDLVFSQQPASQAWVPVTPWDFESRSVIEGPHAKRIMETFPGCTVLDAGCGPGHLVRLLREQGADARGFDVTPQAGHPWFFQGDLTDERELFEGEYYADLVIYREVNEHLTLREIKRAIANLCKLSTRYVYGTTQFHPAPRTLLDVATSDDRDPSHISLVTKDFLRVLFALEGFRYRTDLSERMVLGEGGRGRTFVFERAA